MLKCIIALSSVNYSVKGERILKNHGLITRIVKLQPNKTKNGCAYGLEIDCDKLLPAENLLTEYGIHYTEVLR